MAAVLTLIIAVVGVYTVSMPNEITIFEDEIKTVDLNFPFGITGDDAVSVMASESDKGFLTYLYRIKVMQSCILRYLTR